MSAGVAIERISFRNTLDLVVRQTDRLAAPHWTRGGPSVPAAFPGLPTALALTVELVADAPSGLVKVRNARAGGTLPSAGALAETPVDFAGGTRATVDVEVPLLDPCVDVGTVAWNWESCNGGPWQPAGASEHEIAITLGVPTAPWDVMRPWWEVVRHACAGARGAATVPAAATKMTHHTFNAFAISAYHWEGSTNYATNGRDTPRTFDCATFLRLLDGEDLPDEVDCTDLAAVLSTFANILGCSLDQIAIAREMTLHPILVSNHQVWGNRGEPFGIHEFAVTGDAVTTGREPELTVWDACLMLSGPGAPDSPGSAAPNPADVPAGMPIATYLQRLLVTNTIPFHERQLIRGVHPIGRMPTEVSPLPDADAPGPSGIPPEQTPRIPHLELRDLALDLWGLIPDTDALPDIGPPSIEREKVLRLLWRLQRGHIVSCTVYLCLNSRRAQRRTEAILSDLGVRRSVTRTELGPTEGLPDVRFELGEGAIIVGTLLNVVYVVKRAKGPVTAAQVRRFADAVRVRVLDSRPLQ